MNANLAAIADAKLDPPDWTTDTVSVGWNGVTVDVDYTTSGDSIEIDGFTYGELSMEASDLPEHVIEQLTRAVRFELRDKAAMRDDE